jgi:hypothetical protein
MKPQVADLFNDPDIQRFLLDGIPSRRLLDVLEALTDPEPCQWDHNHSCQAHSYFGIPHGEDCPVQLAKDILSRHDRSST